ncbi:MULTISPECIES: class I SAM-dependent methyltransferase [Romboutsia]|uniref:Methyltransferase n=1 Tax=Romboutsia hominis TaxID=1507512 RepID=A0A2P2BNC4_9FIRM|nr:MULTISPECIES: SAM-dependent methyltransferase [Romboutsia]MCH1959461.1 SAM-dependent methyltransferase [Romboutsia hominis]MCH1970361.1 SAM-dependent methyltransferase [Romboutsia hominis]MDB8793052.1 SAM-dependent methyltransferase [Romboutsia sp. 1001216sp1]MDB8795845.1 SAM-dependent methyltransferase [Romboutsia sp. 1001216sp1]MDB8799340.1 SAM-dependent methyltransferase [Romboutsia sp. 1001216sp1]
MEELIKSIDEITKDEVIKVVISNKKNKDIKYNKINIVLKEKNNKEYYQIEKYTDKQVFHENIEKDELNTKLLEYIGDNYKQLAAWTISKTFDLKVSKKGKIFLGKKNSDNSNMVNKSHNKEKNYILKEGMIIQPLIDLGVFTKEGKVVKSKYDKYKQINRFIEIIDDEIKKNNYKELTILDFGCGKSYLTFVLYYYFVEIKKIDVKMIGLDLKADVIKKCNDIAKKYNYDNLSFELGDINGYRFTDKVDMVITLHACDTATDYALYNAIKWNTKMIFSVPCCQHEFNSQMKSDEFSLLTKYGIIQERMAALMTDAVRANLLESIGYKTQLLEFIDIAHSPKNILIRAAKGKVSKEKREKALNEVNNLISEFNFKPTLYKLLKDDKLI